MSEVVKEFRHSWLVRGIFVVSAVGTMLIFGPRVFEKFSYLGLVPLCGMCLLAVMDVFVSRISLKVDALEIVRSFGRQVLLKSDIEKVTWEAGGGVAIRLKNNKWIKLPTIASHNAQARTNELRAWLNSSGA